MCGEGERNTPLEVTRLRRCAERGRVSKEGGGWVSALNTLFL